MLSSKCNIIFFIRWKIMSCRFVYNFLPYNVIIKFKLSIQTQRTLEDVNEIQIYDWSFFPLNQLDSSIFL